MYIKLAIRNVRRSFKDYTIYFLTLMFGVCIFYVFNSIESQQTMMELKESQFIMLATVNRFMGYASVFISVILGFLIVYASRFIIKRRKKELGIYQTLGMEKGQIAAVLNIETLLVAVISLFTGLTAGVFLSQGCAVVTASLFDVKLKDFIFIFSPSAAGKAIFNFGIIFLLVMLLGSIEIGRQKLIDLIYAGRKNERFKTPRLWLSVILFILSVICLGAAYIIISENGLSDIGTMFLISIVLGITGTFLFFLSLSGFFLKLIQQNKRIYYKDLNMFTLRQLNSKVNTTYVSLTMVCLMLFSCICILSNGIGISKALTARLEEKTPYDASFWLGASREIYNDKDELVLIKRIDINVQRFFNEASIPYAEYAKNYAFVKYYKLGLDINLKDTRDNINNERIEGSYRPDFIKLSDFNKLLLMQGKEPVALGEHDFIINCNNDSLKQPHLDYQAENKITILGKTLSFAGMTEYYLENSQDGDYGTFIVRDEIIPSDSEVRTTILSLNYLQSGEKYEQIFSAVRKEVMSAISDYNYKMMGEEPFRYEAYIGGTRIQIFENAKSSSVMIAYLGVYVGIVFLIISAAVLAITQLSEAADNRERYTLLSKLGADNAMVSKALFSQIGIYFLAPLLLAIVHSIVGIMVVSRVAESIGQMNVLGDSLFTVLVLAIIYGGYFIATYMGSKRIVINRNL